MVCLSAGTYSQAIVYARPLTSFVTLRCLPGAVLTNPSGHTLRVNEPGAFLRVENCRFVGSGVTSGGVIDSYGSNISIVGGEVTGSNDNGIYTDEQSDHNSFVAIWIHHNGAADANQDHGIYLQGDDHVVANNKIHDHPLGFGIQHYDYGRRARIVNNTITNSGHGGIVLGGSGSGPEGSGVAGAVAVNNIVAFNGSYGIDRDSTAPTSCSIHHNLGFSNASGNYDSGWPADCLGLNLSGSPLFVNHAVRDLHVQAGSPAIDAGDAALASSPDFDGTARPRGAGPDIGAFER
jgi:parallel beta-helix repeat protein